MRGFVLGFSDSSLEQRRDGPKPDRARQPSCEYHRCLQQLPYTPAARPGCWPQFAVAALRRNSDFQRTLFLREGLEPYTDRETGIGAWSVDETKRALTEGIRPNGVPLAMIMPYSFLRVLNPDDLEAMVVYLRSIPAIRNEVPSPVYKIAMPPPRSLAPKGQ